MSGMDDLVTWLRGRLDERERELAEDEQTARNATQEHDGEATWPIRLRAPDDSYERILWLPVKDSCDPLSMPPWMAAHMSRHDPARVLAEVERGRRGIAGKRAILELTDFDAQFPDAAGGYDSACEDVIKLLAQEFEGEPGWREDWRA